MNLKELTEKLAAKGKIIHQIYEEAGEDLDFAKVKCLEGDTTAKVAALRAIDKEVTDLKADRDKLLELEGGRKRANELHREFNEPANAMHFPGKGAEIETKSLGELFVESKAYKQKGTGTVIDINLKTLMQTEAGWAPEATRIPRVELYPLRPIAVVDFFPILNTTMSAIKYIEETTFTNNAAEVAQGAPYGEAALALPERSIPVEKIATWLPVTDEQLEDVEGINDYINSRLTYMLRARLDSQLLNGSGTPPNLRGTLNVVGIQDITKGADPTPDAIYKLFTAIRSLGFAEPSVLFLHPNDWQAIRLLTSADGDVYLFGPPSQAAEERVWGVPVLQSTAVVEHTGVAGDFRGFAAIYLKRGIEFKVSDSHDTYFIYGKQAIRADMRCSVVHFRPKAFGKVTGI